MDASYTKKASAGLHLRLERGVPYLLGLSLVSLSVVTRASLDSLRDLVCAFQQAGQSIGIVHQRQSGASVRASGNRQQSTHNWHAGRADGRSPVFSRLPAPHRAAPDTRARRNRRRRVDHLPHDIDAQNPPSSHDALGPHPSRVLVSARNLRIRLRCASGAANISLNEIVRSFRHGDPRRRGARRVNR